MDFKNVPKKYRPVPFWSWNEKLDTAETDRQIRIMDKAGMGGFFMHARCGLQTEYMGEEWFDNIEQGVKTAKELGMYAWAYDENGWPSGFGSGKVNGKGIQYQQKYLRMADDNAHDHIICEIDGKCFYYDVNPFYVDTLDGDVIADFIHEIYEPYYERFQNEITGFFTDEPQISRNGIPWSLTLPEQYEKAYGDALYPHLEELFVAKGDYKTTRMRFWKLITELFSKNCMKQIYDWCTAHDLKFTGHLVLEETFESQLTSNGAVMPHYEYLSIPGMDCLTRQINTDLTSYQLGSTAQQLGKKQVLSETFALCGHNVSFEELKGIYEHQMVHGVNLLCQHLEGYSLRGIRKRDYPPAMYYQQPWWDKYKIFCDSMARTGMILAEGKYECDTLLLHPQSSAWILFDNDKNEGLDDFYARFKKVVNDIDAKHVPFHLGDEILIERHGSVQGDRFVIGEMSYSTVIVPEHIAFFENTEKLLAEFKKNGGKVITPDEVTARNDVVDNPNILYTKRRYEGFDVYYLINPTPDTQTAKIPVGGQYIDQTTGEVYPFCGEHTFAPYDSLMVLDDGKAQTACVQKELKTLDLSGKWHLDQATPNLITLDFCDYYFDGELQEKHGYVLNIQNRACSLKRPVQIKQDYFVNVEAVPSELYLLCETPEMFEISVNGQPISNESCGWYIDKAFKKINIQKYIVEGENKISFATNFKQSAEVYENLEKSLIFESEKNKLTYNIEIEPCYLMGDFGVYADGQITNLDRDAFRYHGDFRIGAPKNELTLSEIEKQGYLFFAGTIQVSKKFCLDDTNYRIAFDKTGVNAITVDVNGQKVCDMIFGSYSADLSDYLHPGENEITISFRNNLRNMMGPHHLKEGECYIVGPHSFFKENCVWNKNAEKNWDEDYCFVNMSLIKK